MKVFVFWFMLAMMAGNAVMSLECEPPQTGDSQTLQERAKVPRYIVHGTVILKLSTVANESKEYEVKFDPLCWLKRGQEAATTGDDPMTSDDTTSSEASGNATNSTNQDDMGLMNITVKEDLQDCYRNDLKIGREYILFLKKYQDDRYVLYTVFDVNEERGAIEEPSDEDFKAVYRGIYESIKARPDAECKEGVVIPCFLNDGDECSRGVAQGVTMWALVFAAVISLVGYL